MGNGKSIIDWKSLNKEAEVLLAKLGFEDINVSRQVGDLSIAYQQVVEICKALSRDSKVIIFDEPTAVLTVSEVSKLFEIIETLKANGVCTIYISHRLEEIFEICDRITVLKDGMYVDTVNVKDTSNNALVRLMIGRDLNEFFPPRNVEIGEVILSVKDLCSGKSVDNVSFEVRKGEVLGFNGLVGAGRTETMRAIFGADKLDSGDIILSGKKIKVRKPKEALKYGIGMLPEDRKNQGVLLDQSVKVNGSLSFLDRISNSIGVVKQKEERKTISSLIKKLSVKTASMDLEVSSLSGGNQQKVALMKWLGSGCEVLILDEPTRGVDVGAKIEIYKVINQLAENGVAIIMISSEMPEIIGMSDRAIIMRQGKIMGECENETLTEHGCIELSMGVKE
jgi:ribose transport system ATP-binding protein